jgi:mannosyltransferase OCH1-like enzyme
MAIPKIIWVLWIDFNNNTTRDLDSLNESIRIYITNMINTQPTFEIRYILSKAHLEKFIEKTGTEINENIWNIIDNAVISPAHKSDFIRFYLLNKYGGIWIDTTTILFYDLSNLIGEYDLVLPYMSINKAIELFFEMASPKEILAKVYSAIYVTQIEVAIG